MFYNLYLVIILMPVCAEINKICDRCLLSLKNESTTLPESENFSQRFGFITNMICSGCQMDLGACNAKSFSCELIKTSASKKLELCQTRENIYKAKVNALLDICNVDKSNLQKIKTLNDTYYLTTSVGSWFNAQHQCQMKGLQIAAFELETEYLEFSNSAANLTELDGVTVFIGLTDLDQEGHFIWTGSLTDPALKLGVNPTNYSFNPWSSAATNDETINCVSFGRTTSTSKLLWSPHPCKTQLRGLCEVTQGCKAVLAQARAYQARGQQQELVTTEPFFLPLRRKPVGRP